MLLPSPRTSDTNGAGHHGDGGMDLRTAVSEITLLPTPMAQEPGGTAEQYRARWAKSDGRESTFLPLSMAVQLLPTPAARDGKNAGDPARTGDRMSERGQPLSEVAVNALLPTPRATDGTKGGPNQRGSSGDLMLPSAVNLLPTPKAHDGEFGTPRTSGRPPEMSTHLATAVEFNITRNQGECDGIPSKGRPDQDLRDVRGTADSQEVRQWAARGSGRVPAEEVLLPELREHPDGDHPLRARLSSEGVQEGDVRGVRREEPPARTSPRPELAERRPGQPRDAVCLMPSQAPLAGGSRGPCGCDTSWGQYEAAIRRWEGVLGRCAPPPTELGPKGNPRLSARFSEFLMGLPAGWVTGVPGITRNKALKALGNGVVPQQCAAALRLMLSAERAA